MEVEKHPNRSAAVTVSVSWCGRPDAGSRRDAALVLTSPHKSDSSEVPPEGCQWVKHEYFHGFFERCPKKKEIPSILGPWDHDRKEKCFFLEHLNLLAIKAGRLLHGMVGKLTTHLKTGSCQRFHANKIEIYIYLHYIYI